MEAGDRVRYAPDFLRRLSAFGPTYEDGKRRGTVLSICVSRRNPDQAMVLWDDFPDSPSLLTVTNVIVDDSQDPENPKEES